LIASAVGSGLFGWHRLSAATVAAHIPAPSTVAAITPELGLALYDEATRNVVPVDGFRSRISLRASVVDLVSRGVIDPERFAAAYDEPEAPTGTLVPTPPLPDGIAE